MTDTYTAGYPDSDPSDLDPGPDEFESLEDADRETEAEGEVGRRGRRPQGSIDDEDARGDPHDADELADTQAVPHLGGGRGRQDRPNFNDNVADWSREKS
jgi:hypothetical protein